MSFSHDRRGQSVVVGTVILFGFLILALASYQAFAVPAQNNAAEFEHSQDVQSDMQDLRASLLDVRDARENPYQRPVRVGIGFRYDSRLFAVNPSSPEGALTTQDRGPVDIRNARVDPGEANRFENTNPLFDQTHDTLLLTYRPNYNEYQNPPRTTFEHSFLYNRFDGADRSVTGQRTVDGDDRTLLLVAYSNDIDRQGLSTTIDPETIDGPTPTVPIGPDEGEDTFQIDLPTNSPNAWVDILEEEDNVVAVDPNENSVTVELDGTWDLQMARIGYDGRPVAGTPFSNVTQIDTDDPDTNRFDVRWNEPDPTNIEEGSTVPLDILVSDRTSDEPITDASVDVSVAPRGDVSGFPSISDSPETDTDGETVVDFDANEAEAGDSFDLFAVAGDDIDQIRVDIIESGTLLRLFPDDFNEIAGSLENFENMQNDDGAVAEFRGSPPDEFNIETFTRDVPTGEYALELGIGEVDLQGAPNGISVTVEDEDGTELASTTIDDGDENSEIRFNVGNIDPEQDITVRYEADRQNDELDVDYQRLVRSQE